MYANLQKDAVGLGGGRILSGSVNASFTNAFWYYPVTATSASVIFSDLTGGSINTSFTAGIGVSGTITAVSQSSGIAVVYNATIEPTITY